jgi:catechol 2,3-dioxygenase-like lactoylglutathione lyase family enzyme
LRPRARLDGLHHVTAITADVATNLDFYARLEDRRDELEQRFPVLPNPRA